MKISLKNIKHISNKNYRDLNIDGKPSLRNNKYTLTSPNFSSLINTLNTIPILTLLMTMLFIIKTRR